MPGKRNPYKDHIVIMTEGSRSFTNEEIDQMLKYRFLKAVWEIAADGKYEIDLSGYEPVKPECMK